MIVSKRISDEKMVDLKNTYIKPSQIDTILTHDTIVYTEEGKLLLVYSFSPFVILEPNLETGECSVYQNETQKYNYSNFRGGSQGFYIGDSLYFIIHEVVFDNGRIYFHRFVKVDKDLNIEKVSYPFYFQNWGIEYVTGAIYDQKNNRILISWGSNDKLANLSSITIENLNLLFEQ